MCHLCVLVSILPPTGNAFPGPLHLPTFLPASFQMSFNMNLPACVPYLVCSLTCCVQSCAPSETAKILTMETYLLSPLSSVLPGEMQISVAPGGGVASHSCKHRVSFPLPLHIYELILDGSLLLMYFLCGFLTSPLALVSFWKILTIGAMLIA